ncbi:lipoate--protein ligase family protein [Carnobacterium gallinarum]|uniref:lipoate--protein ligase family protein n=1 Tax=Carnobacterium gallinarum TaxID=2749 RepID=UPI0005546583|nr:lipoate--protein ligase family protein [Carnobacterium gallinarum]
MTELTNVNYLYEQPYELFDSKSMPFSNQFLSHFALGDSLLKQVGANQAKGALHFWTAEELVILGMMDTKLPYFQDGLTTLEKEQKNYLVRNAGGLAVVADSGILNLSLILPESLGHKISIDAGYEYMLQLIRQAFKDYGKQIEAYEIVDSYCPGDFDLSIDGKKFAGIAQRRMRNGVGIMIYMSVNGNQKKRSEMIQRFYTAGLKGEATKWKFPAVDPDVMANLDELLETTLTVEQVKELILTSLRTAGNQITTGSYTDELVTDYQIAFTKMVQRNEQMLQDNLNKELLQ